MAITLTYTFTAGTRIQSSQVNDNFSTLSTRALDKQGDTMTGNLLFTDATYDIGASGATRPRDLFLSRNATIGGTLSVTGVPTFSATTMSLRGVTYTWPAADGTSGQALTTNGSATLSWATVSANGADIAFTGNFLVRRNTSDAADNGSVELQGGGATGSSRGGGVTVYGNEHATLAGDVVVQVGNVAGSEFAINRADGTEVVEVIGSSGNVGIGGVTAGTTFHVFRNATGDAARIQNARTVDDADTLGAQVQIGTAVTGTTAQFISFAAAGTTVGKIRLNNNATAYDTTSDERLKDAAPTSRGLETLLRIPVHDFAWKADPKRRIYQGFLAQHLYPLYPEAVGVGSDDPQRNPWSVDYGRLTPLLVKAVQELYARVAAMEARCGCGALPR